MKRSFVLIGMLVVLFSTVGSLAAQGAVVWPAAEWPRSTPEEQGMDSAQLLELLSEVDERNLSLDSLVVIRNGHLVLDANWYPYTADTLHELYSATKSVVSTLAGIAMDQGYIEGLDQPILELFPGRVVANLDENKQAITVGDVLSMGSGLRCLNVGLNVMDAMHNVEDTMQPILDLSAQPPGVAFDYCELSAHLMIGAVQEAIGRPVREYADDVLFEPLGITDYAWNTDTSGIPWGGTHLHLTPYDAARIGYLFLRDGEWDGQQIVSPEWVATATCTEPVQCPFFEQGYGYYWWVSPSSYTAAGSAGQIIVVSPERDLVVVMLASGRAAGEPLTQARALLDAHLMPAVLSDEPLPANPEAIAALNARIAAIANLSPQPITPLPDAVLNLGNVVHEIEVPIQLWPDSAVMTEERFGHSMMLEHFTLHFTGEDEATLDLGFADDSSATLVLGLDGVPRINDTLNGRIAGSGWALPSTQEGFVAELNYIGESAVQMLTFRLRDNGLAVIWTDAVSGTTRTALAQPAPGS